MSGEFPVSFGAHGESAGPWMPAGGGLGLVVSHRRELSGLGVAADRSVRTPASFGRRANNAAGGSIDRASGRTPAANDSTTADDTPSAGRRE